MFDLDTRIDDVSRWSFCYHDPDNALRKAHEIWKERDRYFRALGLSAGRMEFEVTGDGGFHWDHRTILKEIAKRPDLRWPPTAY
jgi:hypothetical protein